MTRPFRPAALPASPFAPSSLSILATVSAVPRVAVAVFALAAALALPGPAPLHAQEAAAPAATARVAPAQAVPAPSLSYQPLSETAAAITGPITLSANPLTATGNSRIAITLARRHATSLVRIGERGGNWDIADDDAVRGQVFAITRDPGGLVRANTLCGEPGLRPARYAVFFAGKADLAGQPYLGLAVFSSDNPPKNINDPALCGTFSYLPG